MTKLKELAITRSGDKGNHVNIGVIARGEKEYQILKKLLTEEKVRNFFKLLNVKDVKRYELDNLEAFNFVLYGVLEEAYLRTDSQGKALGAAILEMEIE